MKEIRILIVEDVQPMLELLKLLIIGIKGLSVSGSAKSTWEARVELSKNRPDLVLLDEILPGESSLDLLKELVEQSIPTILLTGITDPSHQIPEGAKARLIKPGWDKLEKDRDRFREVIFKLTQ